MASSPRTHAAATLELFQGQAQMMFLWALLYSDRYRLHMVYVISTSLSRAVPTVVLSLTIQPNTLGCLRTTYDLCPSHPDGCTQDISIPLENIHPRIVTCISPSLDILHPCLYDYWRHTKTESERERMNNYLYSSFFLLEIIFTSVHSVCSHWEETTNEIILRKLEPHIAQGDNGVKTGR